MKAALLLCVIILALIAISLSQGNSNSYLEVINEYNRLEKEYYQTTVLGKAGKIDEQQEEERNAISLSQFSNLYNKILEPRVYDSLRFFIAYRLGELNHYFYNEAEALDYYRTSIKLKSKFPGLPDSLFFKPYLFTGSLLYSKNKFDSAMHFYKLAENVLLKYDNRLQEKERLYNTLGAMYYETGNYRLARNYLNKAIEVLQPTHPYYKELLVNYQINLASVLNKLEEYDEAYSIYLALLKTNINTNEINHNIGSINLSLGSARKALDYFRKVSYQTARIINLYNDIAVAFLNLGEYDSAKVYLEKATLQNKLFYTTNTNVPFGLTNKLWGDLYQYLNDPVKALNYYQHALHQFYPAFYNDSIEANPRQFNGVFSYFNLFSTLISKADALHTQFVKTGERHWAELELDTWQAAFELASYVERTYESDEARLFLNKNKYVVHNKPIETAYTLYKTTGENSFLEQVYYFDQKNKASVLSLNQHISNTGNAKQQEDERKLRSDITRLSIKASQVSDSNTLSKISGEIRDLEIQLGKLQHEMTADMVFMERLPSIKQIQKMLDKNTALISYHLSDSALVAIVITRDITNVFQKKFYETFETDLESFIIGLRNFNSPLNIISGFSHRLYSFLVSDIIPSSAKRLIIIPDDELNYLPFEALTSPTGIYLVQNYSVQYQYTTNLLYNQKLDLSNAKTIAIAPFSKRGFQTGPYQWEHLPSSGVEVKSTKGTVRLDSAATKINFINSLPDNEIIHLATHAVANDSLGSASYIAFYPSSDKIHENLLYEQEIYNLELSHTKLVVLSACETAAGSLVRGEGVMSLSRAFTYAGCPNIVTSLWKADDATTAMLMQHMHQSIENGMTFDKALQEAKKYILTSPSINPRMKHPAYWANFIYIGNFEPETPSLLWLFIPALIFILTVLLIKKIPLKRDRSSSQDTTI